MNEENHRGKISPGEFKVTTSKNPLLLKQVVTSGYKNPSNLYKPTIEHLFPIHNWTCNVVTISYFNARLQVHD